MSNVQMGTSNPEAAKREESRRRHAEADARGVLREGPCECCGEASPRRIFDDSGEVWYTCGTCYMGACPACEDAS